MAQFFEERGSLDVSIGEGQLAAFEVSQMREGDIVVSQRLAGEPYLVTFNGGFLCRAQVVIIGHLFGIRVYSLVEGNEVSRLPVGGDRIMELLPFSILLGSIEVSLAELGEATRGTIISLGKEFSEDQDAELVVAGISVASGKVVVSGENLGLRISRINSTLEGEYPTLATGALRRDDGGPEKMVPFNFKRPDIFTRTTIDRVGEIHRSLARSLSIADSRLSGIEVQTLDQLAVYEMMDELKKTEHRYLRANTVDWRLGDVSLTGPAWPLPPLAEPLIEESDTTHPVSDRDKEYIEHLVYSGDSLVNKPVLIGWSCSGVVGEVFEQEAFQRRILRLVRDAWRTVVEFNLREEAQGSDAEEMVGVHRNELAMLVELAIADRPEESLFFLYPALTLYPVLSILNR